MACDNIVLRKENLLRRPGAGALGGRGGWLGRALLALGLIGALGLTACTEEAPKKTEEDTEEATDEDVEVGDLTTTDTNGTPGDGVTTDGGPKPDGTAPGDDADASTTPDASTDDTTAPVDAAADDTVDTTSSDTDAGGKPDVKLLPLPDCAKGNCGNCVSKCSEQPICVDGKNYVNDCQAICDLKAYDWPATYQISPKKCPECAACAGVELKCDNVSSKCQLCEKGSCKALTKSCTKAEDCADAAQVCATLKSGAKVTVDLACKTKCMELKEGLTNPTVGACKSTCSQPPPAGAGCPINKYQPVCAKEDGKTYQTECAMQNCDLQGCYPVGDAGKTTACVPDKMTKECDGECFDIAGAPNCPKECNAVCGILPTGKGQSYRNECIATTAGAKVGKCDGISATPTDECSASMYKGKGCCPDVDYTSIKQVCASHPGTNPDDVNDDKWVTFRNNAEFECLTGGDKLWQVQYAGPCICKCSNVEKPVCGDDGVTYTNKCQAECYNPGGKFGYKDGPC